MKRLIMLVVLLCVVVMPCWAGVNEGKTAYERKDYATALREFLPLAQRGDAAAQLFLGKMYKGGHGVPQNDAKAVQWWRRAADQGNADAQFALSAAYAIGVGVPQNGTDAVQWLRRAAEQGDATTQLFLAAIYYTGKLVPPDYVEAARWYRRAAEQGSAFAQFKLGSMYDQGQGVSQDYAEALKWYRQAAEQGHPSAQGILGIKYEQGQGVPQNYTEAVQWYRRAADQGNEVAQLFLGIKYEDGAGVPQDYIQAHLWFNLAASHFPPGSMRDKTIGHRERVAAKMTPTQLARAQELASAWQPRLERLETPMEPSPGAAAPQQLAQPTSASQADSPLGVVQAYYADVNRHDVAAARGKWKTPPPRLQDIVQHTEWFRIEDIQLIDVDASAAHVAVMVTGKRRDQSPEQWGGTIALEKRAGVWKIVTMPLTKQ